MRGVARTARRGVEAVTLWWEGDGGGGESFFEGLFGTIKHHRTLAGWKARAPSLRGAVGVGEMAIPAPESPWFFSEQFCLFACR